MYFIVHAAFVRIKLLLMMIPPKSHLTSCHVLELEALGVTRPECVKIASRIPKCLCVVAPYMST